MRIDKLNLGVNIYKKVNIPFIIAEPRNSCVFTPYVTSKDVSLLRVFADFGVLCLKDSKINVSL